MSSLNALSKAFNLLDKPASNYQVTWKALIGWFRCLIGVGTQTYRAISRSSV